MSHISLSIWRRVVVCHPCSEKHRPISCWYSLVLHIPPLSYCHWYGMLSYHHIIKTLKRLVVHVFTDNSWTFPIFLEHKSYRWSQYNPLNIGFIAATNREGTTYKRLIILVHSIVSSMKMEIRALMLITVIVALVCNTKCELTVLLVPRVGFKTKSVQINQRMACVLNMWHILCLAVCKYILDPQCFNADQGHSQSQLGCYTVFCRFTTWPMGFHTLAQPWSLNQHFGWKFTHLCKVSTCSVGQTYSSKSAKFTRFK